MPSRQMTLEQQDFSAGMARDVAPQLIPTNAVYDHLNGLTDASGSPYKRGGTVNKSGAAFGSAGLRWVFDGYFDAGQRTVFANSSDFGVLASDDSTVVNLGAAGLTYPKSAALLEGCLFIGGGFIYAGSRKASAYLTGTVSFTNGSTTVTGSGTSFTANVDAGMLIQRGNERVYVVASVTDNTHLELRDAYAGVTGSGISYTASPIYTMTAADPYEVSDYYTVCENRLCWLSDNHLRFSEIAAPHTAWNIDNEHDFPEGGNGIGQVTVGNQLIVFTTNGVWTLSGMAFDIVDSNGNPQHRQQVLSRDLVLFGQVGIATWEQAAVVPCIDGIYLIDGISSPQKISRPVEGLYTTYTAQNRRTGRAAVFHGHYLLPIMDDSGVVHDLLVCRLDRPTRVAGQLAFPWSHFDGDGGEITAFAVRNITGNRQPKLYGAQAGTASRVVDCSAYFTPSAAVKNDADGTTAVWDLITRDYETGNMTKNAVRAILSRVELQDAASDNPVIDTYYSLGTKAGDPEAAWDDVTWDDFQWAEDTGGSFVATGCQLTESTGNDRQKCRINKQTRYIRFRFRSEDPCAKLVFRALEVKIRPSGALRR